MIIITNLCKQYSKTNYKALDGINLEIQQGEFIGICGRSGCGKSTLLNLIGGLDSITSGTIYINDVDISKLSDNELCEYRNNHISYIFQSFYLDSNLNVLENIALPLVISGTLRQEREKQAKVLLERFGLADKAKSRPSELSGGQMQRVAIARSLITNPQIILADEPTGNLDSHNASDIIELLRDINAQGTTIILVSHNRHDLRYCSKLIHLHDGRIMEDAICV